MLNSSLRIGSHLVGAKEPCFVIAEVGVNHNGNIGLAHRLIESAAEAGADSVKFQIFQTDQLVAKDAPLATYQKRSSEEWGNQRDMLKDLELTIEQQSDLKRHCESLGLEYLCTPYEEFSLKQLISIGIKGIKVASTDTNNIPFLRQVALTKKPVFLSTGMSTMGEIETALNSLNYQEAQKQIVLMHCTSQYPAPIEDCNLRALLTLKAAFGCLVGFSDHTVGVGASPWAVALGACVIEKHFTIDKNLPGPDHGSSLNPLELNELILAIRSVEKALGDGIKKTMPSEQENRRLLRKSIIISRKLDKNEVIQAKHLICKRPGFFLSPEWYERMLGRRAARRMEPGHFVTLNDILWDD